MMKNITFKIKLCLFLLLSLITKAQILTNGNISSGLTNTNYFLDASNFELLANTHNGKGLGFPRTNLTTFVFNMNVSDTDVIASNFDGMLVYNSATGNTLRGQGIVTAVTPGYYYFSNPGNPGNITNGKWVPMGGCGCEKPEVTTLNCAGSTISGALTVGAPSDGVSVSVPYTGGNGIDYSSQTVASNGVNGLIAVLNNGTLNRGNGTLTYTIIGTPSSSGTANFPITIAGQSCTLNIPVDAVTTTGPLVTNLNCSSSTIAGSLTQGTSASGVSISVPYTGGNSIAYPAQAVGSTGVNGLTANLSAGTLANGNGTLTYTITGIPASSGTASFLVSIGGKSCTVTIEVKTNVVDPMVSRLNCSASTFNGVLMQGVSATSSPDTYGFIPYTGGNGQYVPNKLVYAEGVPNTVGNLGIVYGNGNLNTGGGNLDFSIVGTPPSGMTAARFPVTIGSQSCTVVIPVRSRVTPTINPPTVIMPGNSKAWMRHNLGADYSKDPDVPTKEINGNYYQWGRSEVKATPDTPMLTDLPFWNYDATLWDTWKDNIKTSYDPCPAGFRVPTKQQFINLVNNVTWTYIGTLSSSIGDHTNFSRAIVGTGGGNKITLPAAGHFFPTVASNGPSYMRGAHRGIEGWYWTSHFAGGTDFYNIMFFKGTSSIGVERIAKQRGHSIRCIQE